MTLANCERLAVEDKISLGRVLLERVRKKMRPQELWSLSRLGARVPLYGPLNKVIGGKEASSWLKVLFSLKLPLKDAVAQALVQLARLTGDRVRDVPEEDRDRVSAWLQESAQPEHFKDLLLNRQSVLTRQDQDWIFGESLPTGLNLSRAEPS
jgi:hypothetical protein